VITPGQWGDSPQARGLIEGLDGVSHVIADAAYAGDYPDFCARAGFIQTL
jgi:transposase